MRLSLYIFFAMLMADLVVQAHPIVQLHDRESIAGVKDEKLSSRQAPTMNKLARRAGYKAVGLLEDKRVIAGGLVAALLGIVGAGVGGMRMIEHHACEKVAEQERIMQQSWDRMHPDGFVGAGDQMRPATFDCKVQESKLKPLTSYANAPHWY